MGDTSGSMDDSPHSEPQPAERGISGSVGHLRLFGIPVRFHFTFVLLIIYLVVLALDKAESSSATVIYVIALFASVLFHELGHALVARRYGIRTLEILMLPIGGVARLEKQPQRKAEFWISLAGPMVNFVLAGLIVGYLAVFGKIPKLEDLTQLSDQHMMARIAAGNLILGLFNLLPAFPMDGGRILRAILSASRPEHEATRTAARVGMGMAALMALFGLLTTNFMLVFIAFFVYLGAMQESLASAGRHLMTGELVQSAMITDFRTLRHGDTIRDAANLLLATSQQDFPVLAADSVVGLLNRTALLRAMAHEGPDAYVAGSMERNYISLPPTMDLADAVPLLARAGSCALVMEGDRLAGLLTTENLSEFLVLRRISRGISQSPHLDDGPN